MRSPGPGGRPGGGGPGMIGFAMNAAAKPKSFGASMRRLLRMLRPEGRLIAFVLVLGVVSVVFAVTGPKILGHATNILFDGVLGKQIPAGVTKAQAVAALRAGGQDQVATMLAGTNVTPGQGVDFGALGSVLLLLVGFYLLSALFGWAQSYLMAGVTQRTVYRLRQSVDQKLGRLPLAYFDRQSRGDTLSRMTNDIDNIAQSLQQSLTQLITALLTVIGVLIMMLTISPLLAGLSLLAVPLSIGVTVVIAKRSQQQFAAQWKHTGLLNGHIEEMHTGHSIVKVFGRQQEAIETFDAHNECLYQSELQSAVHLGADPAGDELHRQPQLRRDRGHRRPAGGDGHDVAGRRARVHPVLPAVHHADHPDREHQQRHAIRGRFGRAGLRAAR